jgi:hypothetical protein
MQAFDIHSLIIIRCLFYFFLCNYLLPITGFVTRLTRQVPLVEQELLILPKQLSSPPVFSGVRVTRSLVLCVCFVDCCLSFVLFLLAIVLYVLLRYTDSSYPFGIFKLFLYIFVSIHQHLTSCLGSCQVTFHSSLTNQSIHM